MRSMKTGARLLLAVATLGPSLVLAQNAAMSVAIDAQLNRHAISPYIYGVAFATRAQLGDLNAPLNRYGGNTSSRYNWKLNASNRAGDWYFESIAEPSAVAGELVDTFIANSRATGAQAMVTLPMLDWVARLGVNRGKLASFSVAKYGAQADADWQWYPDAGNGVRAGNGQSIAGNSPADANVAAGVGFQRSWVQHLLARWGRAANGGLRFYLLDNEPSIWHGTHRDVHPAGAKMAEIRQRMIDYGAMVKSLDPGALVVGPEEWGWSGYLLSGYDQQYGATHGWGYLPDSAAHNNVNYVPWLLSQLHQYQLTSGKRVLDVFSLHFYPQGGEFSNDTSTAMQLRRNRSTRALWDPNYVDASWINARVKLIPRMKTWTAAYYPGLKTAITEYNWGAEAHINGATTQADILGIFGREGLDYAARWTTPAASTPTYKAMKLYRNYDGRKSGFGDISVSAKVPNSDALSAFAAVRTGSGAMTVMVVAKSPTGNTPVTLRLAHFAPTGAAHVWQLTAGNVIRRLPDLAAGSSITTTVPPQSVTLFVVPGA